jgi:hypothetical protein
VPLRLLRGEGVDGDGAARPLRVLREDGQHVRAAGLQARDVEERVRALNPGTAKVCF